MKKTIKIEQEYYNVVKIAVDWMNDIFSKTCPEYKATPQKFIENAIVDKIRMYHDIIETHRQDEIKRYEENQIIQ